ncbi:UDP-glycosyltransferase family 37 member C2 [Carabus blaptoides fortunei]
MKTSLIVLFLYCSIHSHQIVYQSIWNELADRGHELLIFTANPQKTGSRSNLREIDISFMYNFQTVGELSEKIYQHPEMQSLFQQNNLTFDLLMVDIVYPTMIALSVKFQCPYVGLFTMDLPEPLHKDIGNYYNPVVYTTHPNVKVFLTQGGLQSLEEALSKRVPMVSIPFFADQSKNGYKMESLGIGIKVERTALTKDSLKQALMEVAENKKYRINIKRVSELLEDQQTLAGHNQTEYEEAEEGMMKWHCAKIYHHPEVQAIVKNASELFDMLMVDILYPAMIALSVIFTCWTVYKNAGNYIDPVIYPCFSRLTFDNDLSF